MFNKASERKFCPLIKKSCIGSECMWATSIRGTNANTGKDVDEEACAIAWLPMLLIENASQSRSAVAATESFRNEMVSGNEKMMQLKIIHHAQDLQKDNLISQDIQ